MGLPHFCPESCIKRFRAVCFAVGDVRVKWGFYFNTSVWILAHMPNEVINMLPCINGQIVAISVPGDVKAKVLVNRGAGCCLKRCADLFFQSIDKR